jgi:hypothetical protein
MILGASALGQVALGGASAVLVTYVNVPASIAITSSVNAALMIAGQIHVAADIAITSSVQAALTTTPPVMGEVNILATITMVSVLTASLTAMAAFPNAGVSFSMTDKAGGA